MSTTEVKCAGCGKVRKHNRNLYEVDEVVEIEVSVDSFALVCKGRGRGGASEDCARRARAGDARHGLCPGCGGEIGWQEGVASPVLCEACKALLARGRELKAAGADLRFASIESAKFFGEYIARAVWDGDEISVAQKLVSAIVRAVGGRTECIQGEWVGSWGHLPARRGGFDSPHPDFRVECTEAQFQALAELPALFGELLDRIKREGFKAGGDLLGKLARGEVTIDQHDDEAAKRGPRPNEEE